MLWTISVNHSEILASDASRSHLYVVNQDPATGRCYWNSAGVTAPPPPPGAIPFTGAISGGTNP
jgi:hypothetical protein